MKMAGMTKLGRFSVGFAVALCALGASGLQLWREDRFTAEYETGCSDSAPNSARFGSAIVGLVHGHVQGFLKNLPESKSASTDRDCIRYGVGQQVRHACFHLTGEALLHRS